MADNLLSPKSTAPSGVPPKNIVVYLALILLCSMLFGTMYLQNSGPSSAEAKAKKTLEEAAAAKDGGTKGDPKDITDAADQAGVPASLRGEMKPAAPVAPVPTDLPPFPISTPTASPSNQSPSASVDAVRETEIANAKPVVFDIPSSTAQEGAKQENPIDRLIEDERRAEAVRAQSTSRSSDAAQLAGLMGSANTQNQSPATGRAGDTAWLKEYATTRRAPGLKPALPEASLVLSQGSVIEAVSLNEINSDLPGIVRARTTRDIYDSFTQRNVVLPRGTLAMGEYSSQIRMGQERLMFAFTRLILPNGQSFDLTAFNGSDAAGRAGVKGDVDNHYFRLFGTSLLIGLLADRVVATRAVPQGSTGQAGGLSATGQILSDTTKQILERNKEVAPTLSIPSGARLVIEVKRDMLFPSASRE